MNRPFPAAALPPRHEYNINHSRARTATTERCVSFTAVAETDKNQRIAAAEPLTCLPGPFGDASCLLEKVGDCGLSDCQVVGPVRLQGGRENIKSIGPQKNMSLLRYCSLRTGSTKSFPSPWEICFDLAWLADLL